MPKKQAIKTPIKPPRKKSETKPNPQKIDNTIDTILDNLPDTYMDKSPDKEKIEQLEGILYTGGIIGDTNVTRAALDALRYFKEKENEEQEKEINKLIESKGAMVMTAPQQKIFNELTENRPTDQINVGDKMLFILLAKATDNFIRMEAFINKKGEVKFFQTGHGQIRPEVTVRDKAAKLIIDLTKQLGLDTVSKMQHGISNENKDKDKFEELD